jgi:hypothetical protein
MESGVNFLLKGKVMLVMADVAGQEFQSGMWHNSN